MITVYEIVIYIRSNIIMRYNILYTFDLRYILYTFDFRLIIGSVSVGWARLTF